MAPRKKREDMSLPNEIWKDIPEYDLYQASNLGRIRNKNSKHLLSLVPRGNGYIYVTIRQKGEYVNRSVHQLVALAFLPKPENKKYVKHKDYKRENNHLDNLEWANREDLVQHAALPGEKPIYETEATFDHLDLENEIWKDIPNSSGCQVSNYGRVKTKHGDFAKIIKDLRGYCFTTVNKSMTCVHRLVGIAFLNLDPDSDMVINHKDGDKSNNFVDNLEVVTHSRNIKHAYENGMLENSTKRRVYQVDYLGNICNEFDSMTAAEAATGFNRGSIWNAIETGATSHGYRWFEFRDKYEEEMKSGKLFESLFKVIQCDMTSLQIINTFDSYPEAENKTGVSKASVAQACKKGCNGGGFKWFNNYANYLKAKK
jgi:hypothetical protein